MTRMTKKKTASVLHIRATESTTNYTPEQSRIGKKIWVRTNQKCDSSDARYLRFMGFDGRPRQQREQH